MSLTYARGMRLDSSDCNYVKAESFFSLHSQLLSNYFYIVLHKLFSHFLSLICVLFMFLCFGSFLKLIDVLVN